MANKTSKQKCLEMWEWLRDNPGKDKEDYHRYLKNTGLGHEYEFCWACIMSKECTSCVVDWPGDDCMHPNSPYHQWKNLESCRIIFNKNLELRRELAQQVVTLIKTTWKDWI